MHLFTVANVINIITLLTLSGWAMHIWYSGRMHTPPVGITFNFFLIHFEKHIYTIFVIICLVRYACKHTDYKQQYNYGNHLLIKILTQKIFLLRIAKFKSNTSGWSLQLKKLNHPIPKGLKNTGFFS